MWYVNLYNVTLRSVSSYMSKKKKKIIFSNGLVWMLKFMKLYDRYAEKRYNDVNCYIYGICVYFRWISKNVLTWCERITKVGNWWLWHTHTHTLTSGMRKLKLPHLYAVAFLPKAHWQWLIDIGSLFFMVLINSSRSTSH